PDPGDDVWMGLEAARKREKRKKRHNGSGMRSKAEMTIDSVSSLMNSNFFDYGIMDRSDIVSVWRKYHPLPDLSDASDLTAKDVAKTSSVEGGEVESSTREGVDLIEQQRLLKQRILGDARKKEFERLEKEFVELSYSKTLPMSRVCLLTPDEWRVLVDGVAKDVLNAELAACRSRLAAIGWKEVRRQHKKAIKREKEKDKAAKKKKDTSSKTLGAKKGGKYDVPVMNSMNSKLGLNKDRLQQLKQRIARSSAGKGTLLSQLQERLKIQSSSASIRERLAQQERLGERMNEATADTSMVDMGSSTLHGGESFGSGAMLDDIEESSVCEKEDGGSFGGSSFFDEEPEDRPSGGRGKGHRRRGSSVSLSDMLSRDSTVSMDLMTNADAKALLEMGGVCLKYSKQGKTQKRFVMIRNGMKTLCWRDPSKSKFSEGFTRTDVVRVIAGLVPTLPQKISRVVLDENLVACVETDKRILLLEYVSEEERDRWVFALLKWKRGDLL
ncbi:hypothetical protein ADUPG1_011522, partial [Aduncisulcus paluster]